jgi:tetratricopeptide (TPR) repeat protein
MKTTLALAILMLPASLAAAQDKMAEQLRKGIDEEEANQNLDKAIQVYQSILAQFDEERKTAATTLFHLAGCYRKQGKTDQAIAAYKRVIQEFPDQNKLADASRTHLSKTFGISQTQVAAPAKPEIAEARRRYRALLEDEIRLMTDQILQMEKRVVIGTISPNDREMVALKRDVLELKRALAAFDAGVIQVPPTSIR